MCRYISGKYGCLQIEYALRFRWKHLVRLSFAHTFHELPEHRFSQLFSHSSIWKISASKHLQPTKQLLAPGNGGIFRSICSILSSIISRIIPWQWKKSEPFKRSPGEVQSCSQLGSPTDRWQLEQSTWYPRCPIRHPAG